MAAILLSIKPQYVEKILSGVKAFEYRKHIPKQEIDLIVIYETSPQKRIVGIAEVKGILKDTPKGLWESTKEKGGVTKKAYMEYFKVSKEAYAFILGPIRKFKNNYELDQLGVSQPPQSYVYINDKQMGLFDEELIYV